MFADRVCQQQGISLWVPFQNAATAVTNLYKGKYDVIMTKEPQRHMLWFAFGVPDVSEPPFFCPIREHGGPPTQL